MLNRFSEPQIRTVGFLVAVALLIVGIVFGHACGGIPLASLVAVVGVILSVLFFRTCTPAWFGRTKVQTYSLAVLSGAAILVLGFEAWWMPFIASACQRLSLPIPSQPTGFLKFSVLAVLAFSVCLLNYFWSRKTIIPPSDVAPSDTTGFVAPGYVTLRDEFCAFMVRQLDQYDRDVHWSDSEYRTLEAEIEMDQQGSLRPTIARDLIKAVHADRISRAFLLLGEPGAGKSVSLRRLCRELYAQVQKTGIVPVYVNLREWDGPTEPTDADISAFLLRHLKNQSGRSGIKFLDANFDKMLQSGSFFFILDSFDEMPAVLDCDDADNRLQSISRGFHRFFNDLHNCRGLLSSRFFRQPRGFAGRRLLVRPFSEDQVRGAVRRWLLGQPIDADAVILRLLREKPEFSAIVRNPFSADLVAQFLVNNPGKLPESYFAVFDDYVNRRLQEDIANLKNLNVSADEVQKCATRIAWQMYAANDIGLDVEVSRLPALIDDPQLPQHLKALSTSRLARIGGVHSQRFSFAHRRFAEFFVVRKLIAEGESIPLTAIPSDSRWRDCLVVYCGVAPQAEAQKMADYCWSEFRAALPLFVKGDLLAARPAIHCLRFLIEGFRSRLDCIEPFQNELSEALKTLLKSDNVLVMKIAAEALCLANERTRNKAMVYIIRTGVSWISETVIRTCRHLGGFSDEAKDAIRYYVATIPADQLYRDFRSLSFSFRLSHDLRRVRMGLISDRISLPIVRALWLIVVSILLAGVLGFNDSGAAFAKLRESGPISKITSGIEWFHNNKWWPLAMVIFIVVEFEFLIRVFRAKPLRSSIRRSPIARGKFRRLFVVIVVCQRKMRKLVRQFIGSKTPAGMRPGFDFSLRVSLVFGSAYVGIWAKSSGHEQLAKALSAIALSSVVFSHLGERVATELFRDWRRFVFMGGKTFAGFSALSAVLMFIFFGLAALIDRFETLKVSALSVLGLLVFGLVVGFLDTLFEHWRDWQRWRAMSVPERLTRPWVYQMCGAMKTASGRAKVLDTLLARGTPVIDEPSSPPTSITTDRVAKEKLARLEEKWLGLEM